MKFLTAITFGLAVMTGPVLAEIAATGDAAKGEETFRKCKSCHMIVDTDGNKIVKGGKTGPNLYGLYAYPAGANPEFSRYGKSIIAAGEKGLVWNEDDFVSYVADPKKFLAEYLGDSKAKSKMTFKLKKAEDAANVWAYLVSVGPKVE